jgi:citronellol/citronellal dehydrogenase
VTGNFFVDDEVLGRAGVTDLSTYAVDPTVDPFPDFFV